MGFENLKCDHVIFPIFHADLAGLYLLRSKSKQVFVSVTEPDVFGEEKWAIDGMTNHMCIFLKIIRIKSFSYL